MSALRRLPPGWTKYYTQDNRPYYLNHDTQTTQWTPPPPIRRYSPKQPPPPTEECKICNMKFYDQEELSSHISIHIGRKCKVCNQTFKSSTADTDTTTNPSAPPALLGSCHSSHEWLSKEWQKIKPKDKSNVGPLEPPPTRHPAAYPIASYDKSTVSMRNFIPDTNEWKCSFCEYTTCSRHRLTKHMRVHTNERYQIHPLYLDLNKQIEHRPLRGTKVRSNKWPKERHRKICQ